METKNEAADDFIGKLYEDLNQPINNLKNAQEHQNIMQIRRDELWNCKLQMKCYYLHTIQILC